MASSDISYLHLNKSLPSDAGSGILNLSATLASGQNFRWRRDQNGSWWGVVGDSVLEMGQPEGRPDGPLFWQTYPERDQWDLVRDYFRLNVDLDALYPKWIAGEPAMEEPLRHFRGLRVLRQPPEECFFGFQCAVCNTVVKIERSVHRLAMRYGRQLETGLNNSPFDFFAFPTIDALAAAEEAALRADLWGYRGPRVIALARHMQQLPAGWLMQLREVDYDQAKTELIAFHGVGAKLADCIALFSLDKDEAVPVDTHVRQIACRLFAPELADKSLTPRIYGLLADAYRARFGAYAGWAQQYLFFADLQRARDFVRC